MGCLIIPRLADIYGRKRFIVGCQGAILPVLLYFFVMETVTAAASCFFILGLTFSGTAVVTCLWAVESIVKRHRASLFFVLATCNRLLVIFAVIYFQYLSKDWVNWLYMVVLIQLLVVAGQSTFPESPEFYLAKGRYEECKEVLINIADYNGVKVTADQLKFLENVGKDD